MVTEYYYPHLGGVTEHVHYLSRELRRVGHHVDVVTSTIDSADTRRHVVRIGRSIPVYSNASMARITVARRLREQLRRVFREGAYDLIHVHCPFSPTLPIAAIEAAEVPVVGTVHTWFPSSAMYRLMRGRMQALADRIHMPLAVSESAAEAHARYVEANWRVVPNGVDTSEFRPGLRPPASMRGDAPTILFVGRFDPRNALHILIEAFARVQVRVPRARLIVVGDGPLRWYYRRLARGLPGVTFVGALTHERAAYFATADVYACPTTRASFGITLLESMAAGTPVVCSDLPGFRHVVTEGREALLTQPNNVRHLADTLLCILSDDVMRARMARCGVERARDFCWRRVTTQVLAAYRDAQSGAVTAA